MGIFSELRERKRERAAKANPIADDDWAWALSEHPIFRPLDETRRARLRYLTTAFLAEKDFSADPELKLDPRDFVSIAAQACLPVLELGLDVYRKWHTIIVVREDYRVTQSRALTDNAWEEYEDDLAGEVSALGPVVLSLRDVEESGWGDGFNVVVHEAAHKLDELDGSIDGRPPLPRGLSNAEWARVFGAAYDDLKRKLAAPRPRKSHGRGRRAVPRIDEYAAEDPGEFFAVCCEYFFEKPAVLLSEYPEVFGLLERYFGFSMVG